MKGQFMKCTADQIDILKEMINVGVGKGADVLNTMLCSHVRLQVPSLKILSPEELEAELSESGNECLSCINLPFKGNISGVAELVFPVESASKFVIALTGEEADTTDMDSIRAGALSEIGNIVLNAVMGTISNLLGFKLRYSVPSYTEGDYNSLLPVHPSVPDTTVVVVHTHFVVEKLEVKGSIIMFFEVGSFDKLLVELETAAEGKKR